LKAVAFLDLDTQAKVIAAVQEPILRALVTLLLDAGLRLGEALGLEWSDVDMRRQLVRVRRSKNGRPVPPENPIRRPGSSCAATSRRYSRMPLASTPFAPHAPSAVHLFLDLLALVRRLAADRARLALENVVLRQQLNVLKRSVKRARLDDGDRLFWVLMHRLFKEWKEHLVLVKPETVARWHRHGFRYYWRWKSRAKGGRPAVDAEVIALVRRMSAENVLRGAPRIRSELALLGHDVAESTVAKYMAKPKDRNPSQAWRTFLRNHMGASAACDFFTVPTLTFKLLHAFVVLSHDRRRILHVNVTAHPTAEWTAQQITEPFPGDAVIPRNLHRDRDSIYDGEASAGASRASGCVRSSTRSNRPGRTRSWSARSAASATSARTT
jgi:hypothetical protein